jgi:hypothetical protein
MAHIINLKRRIKDLTLKIDERTIWLVDHHNHPDFYTILRDKNEMAIEVANLKKRIENLENELPEYGYAESEYHSVIVNGERRIQ